MSVWLAVLATGLGTYLSRALFILALARHRIPTPVLAALEFVAPSVIGALTVALLIRPDGQVEFGLPEFAAFGVAGLVAWRTRNHLLTLVTGMATYWLVPALLM